MMDAEELSLTIPPDSASVSIDDVVLHYRSNDKGGKQYGNSRHVAEYKSPFYDILKGSLSPSYCIDIGANYGFTGIIMQRRLQPKRLILVEPVPWLEEYIRLNFKQNREHFDELHSAIASSSDGGTSTFGVKSKSTQDSRVITGGNDPVHRQVKTRVTSIDGLTRDAKENDPVYIKIDVQGWEQQVFLGGEGFLSRHNRWLIKSEFAPAWLDSQGTDPVAFLRYLLSRYRVFDNLERVPYKHSGMSTLLQSELRAGDEEGFSRYVAGLGSNGRGGLDLLVLPKP